MAKASKMGWGEKGTDGKGACSVCNKPINWVMRFPGKKMVRTCDCGTFDKMGRAID